MPSVSVCGSSVDHSSSPVVASSATISSLPLVA